MVGRIDSAALLTGKAHDVTEDKGQRLQHNDDPIPLVDDLETLYAKARLPQEGERWDMVCKQFAYEFGGERPQYIARGWLISRIIDQTYITTLPGHLDYIAKAWAHIGARNPSVFSMLVSKLHREKGGESSCKPSAAIRPRGRAGV